MSDIKAPESIVYLVLDQMIVSLGERVVMRSDFFSTFQMIIRVRHADLHPEIMPRQLGPRFEPKFGRDFHFKSEISNSLGKLVLSTLFNSYNICSQQSYLLFSTGENPSTYTYLVFEDEYKKLLSFFYDRFYHIIMSANDLIPR